MNTPPPEPPVPNPEPEDPRTPLMHRVRETLMALPGYFNSTTNIEGIDASDLFALNTMLGTTIEVQVVQALNRIRDVWDPNDEWPLHRFERQAHTFPDVLLRRQLDSGDSDVALGIELKDDMCWQRKHSLASDTQSHRTHARIGIYWQLCHGIYRMFFLEFHAWSPQGFGQQDT